MQRVQLVTFRKAAVAPDLVDAIRQLEVRAHDLGGVHVQFESRPKAQMTWKEIEKDPGPTKCPPHFSAIPTGREVYLRLEWAKDSGPPETSKERALATLWGLAIPLGFTPWNRYPIVGNGDEVFHFMGPWHLLFDHLLGLGRGEEAWSSFCIAAQSDVGMWEGNKKIERFIQSQLYRLGFGCGVVDGVLGPKTRAAIQGAGFQGIDLSTLANRLSEAQIKPSASKGPKIAHVVFPEENFSIVSYGRIQSTRTRQGAALTIQGPGRVVIDIRES